MSESSTERIQSQRPAIAFWICFAIFMINDLWWMAIRSPALFYLGDFVSRLIVLGLITVVLWPVTRNPGKLLESVFLCRHKTRPQAGYIKNIITWTIIASVAGVAIDQTVWPFLLHRLPNTAFFKYPEYPGMTVKALDLTFGIALVAISEETVFRGLAVQAISGIRPKFAGDKMEQIAWQTVAISCLLFGLIHWSTGLHAIINAALWGILPMVALIRTGSLWPGVIAHLITDITAFSGIVPEMFYKYLL